MMLLKSERGRRNCGGCWRIWWTWGDRATSPKLSSWKNELNFCNYFLRSRVLMATSRKGKMVVGLNPLNGFPSINSIRFDVAWHNLEFYETSLTAWAWRLFSDFSRYLNNFPDAASSNCCFAPLSITWLLRHRMLRDCNLHEQKFVQNGNCHKKLAFRWRSFFAAHFRARKQWRNN